MTQQVRDAGDTPGLNTRCLSLDSLRGIAAFFVLIFHFTHFYSLQAAHPAPGDRLFNPVLWPIYDYGWMAVDLFFQISGFVFVWLYADRIASGKIGFPGFFGLRLARLYPLHLLTLLLVAAGQAACLRWIGGSFVYHAQDGWHFFLNLVMANGLPFAGAESYNGPSWSLSVEMALYVLFFVLARWWGLGAGRAAIMVLAGLAVYKFDSGLGRGISGFYLGGLLFILKRQFGMTRFRQGTVVALCGVGVAVVGLWCVAHLGPHFSGGRMTFAVQLLLRFLVFPAIIAAALSLEEAMAPLWRRMVWLGDVSYSIYLLHIPVQLALVLASAILFRGYGWLVTGYGLAIYLGLVLVLGACSFHGFEQPARRWLKARAVSVWKRGPVRGNRGLATGAE